MRRVGIRSVRRLGPALALAALLGTAAPLAAQQPAGDAAAAEAARAIGELRSPYCPGLMLEICPSPQAAALRDSIRDLAATGLSSDQLVEWMIARHGEEWRGVPETRGSGLWAWIVPPLALLAGAAVVAARLRRGRAEAVAQPEPPSELSDEERARVSEALRELERAGGLDP